MFVHTAEQVAGTYGYHPDPAALEALVNLAPSPADVLVAGRGGADLRDQVSAMRQVSPQALDLPEGLYWFARDASVKVLVVSEGAASASSDVVPRHELTDDHPLSWAEGWMDSLWPDATEVPRPKFRVQQDVVISSTGRDYPVRRRRFSNGRWVYEIRAEGQTSTYSEDMLVPLEVSDDVFAWARGPRDSARRLSATLTREKLAGSFTDTVFSFRATRTLFRAYQFRPVIRMLESGKSRILIADEVGLGKTIEAGLVWTELEARAAADRVLVVCPASLVAKWRNEMEQHFRFQLTELSGGTLHEFEQRMQENRLPRRFAHVISIERLRTWDALSDLVGFAEPLSLAIVDEAHIMRNSGTRSFATGSLLGEWAEALVLLTATPINLRNEDLFNLLELLTPGEFGEGVALEAQLEPNTVLNRLSGLLTRADVDGVGRRVVLDELGGLTFGKPLRRRPEYSFLRKLVAHDRLTPRQVVEARRYIGDLNVLSSVLTRTRRVEVDEKKAVREARDARIQWTEREERFYAAYIDWCRARAEAAGVPVGFAMQMPMRLASACLPAARDQVLYWDRDGGQVIDEDADAAAGDPPATPRLRPHAELLAAAHALGAIDSKYAEFEPKLLDVLSTNRRALVFTFSRPTLQYLARRLGSKCRVAVLHGGVPREKRHEIIADFRAGAYDVVLANRVASEGLDFEFCSVVVNYDLPWNPMEVEQRIGRIDRIGQAEDKIVILNLWCPAALDEQIKERLLTRIGVFEGSIGALEPIVTRHLSELRDAVFDFRLSRVEREEKADATLAAMEAQRSSLEDLASASPFLLAATTSDVAGLEQDIVSTGRYVGSAELLYLLEDWAHTCDAPAPVVSGDGLTLRLRGNREMADRLSRLVSAGRLRAHEVESYQAALRNEGEWYLALDHEAARTSRSADLLSARHPLVLAATQVPEHRRARFASVAVDARGAVEPARVAVLLGVARWGSVRPGQEVWGTAVRWDGRPAADEYVDLLLARLATGDLNEGPLDGPPDLDGLVYELQDLMDSRLGSEGERRAAEAEALIHSRRVLLEEQHKQRREAIKRRRKTALERERERGVALFDRQLQRAEDSHRQTLLELDGMDSPSLSVTPLALCLVEVRG
ncbi:helicase-related protein [Geodermatophilus nigrescens]